jgi:hypothetical protein
VIAALLRSPALRQAAIRGAGAGPTTLAGRWAEARDVTGIA